MPIYEVTQEGTGITLELEGEQFPKKEDVERAFAFAGQQKYPAAPVLQAPPSMYEQAKSVAPSLARVAAPLAFGRPSPEDIATTGRVIQQGSEAVRRLTGGRERPEDLLEGASRIEREGILALGSASPEKRERAASMGGRFGELVSEYTPIPESVTRPVGQVTGQVAADLLSPMNLMSLGIAGAARQAARIPSLVAGAEFAETTTPSAIRAAQIADLQRASEAAVAGEQVGKLVAPALLPPITLGAAESTGIALQTIADPNATPEQKLKASLEAGVGMLFSAGLGSQVGRTFGMKKGVTQAEVLDQLASRKQTVGDAINKVEGLLDEMDRIVPVKNLREEFRKAIADLNPDDPFIYQPEQIGEGPRPRPLTEEQQAALQQKTATQDAATQAALESVAESSGTPLKTAEQLLLERLEARKPPVIPSERIGPPEDAATVQNYIAEQARKRAEAEPIAAAERPEPVARRAAEPQAVGALRTAEDIMLERLRQRDERIAAEEQAALESQAAQAGTPLRTAAEVQAERAAQRQEQTRRAQLIREGLRREFTPEELAREQAAPVVRGETTAPEIITPELQRQAPRAREGGMLPPREAEAAPAAEGTRLRTAEEIMAERIRQRDERIAAEQARIAAEQSRVPLETSAQKLARALELRDRRLAAEAVSEALESGAARGEPVRVTRSIIEKSLGMTEKSAGQAVAQETIFNEVWNKALEETQGKYRQKAESIAQKLEGLRAEVEPGVGANPFPQLMGAAWNGALAVAQAVIRAGGTVADGVAAGIRYAKQNFKGKFDEAEFANQLGMVIERPSPVQVEPGMKARRFAERVAAAPGVPPVIREAVAASPEASYKQQSVPAAVKEASVKSESQLIADFANPDSNTRTISAFELFNRQIAAGDTKAATDTSLALAAKGTNFGQNLNQYKLLKSSTPEGLIFLITKSLAKQNRKPMSPKQVEALGNAMDKYVKNRDALDNAGLKLVEAANSGDKNAYDIAARDFTASNDILRSSDLDLVETIGKINPSLKSDLYVSLVQGSIQSTVSLVGNLFGNVINKPFSEFASVMSAITDSMLFRGRLGSTYDLRARSIDRINSLAKSIPEAKRTLLKGSDVNPYEPGANTGTPLNFVRAGKNLIDKFVKGDKDIPFTRNFIEATLGVYPDMIFRINQSVDNIFRSAERDMLVREIGKRNGMSDLQIKAAQKNPDLYLVSDAEFAKGAKGFTADDLGLIDFESARSVYQQENAGTQAAAGVNRFFKTTARGAFYPAYRIVFPFQKTPINVAAEVLTFAPAGLLRMWPDLTPRERNFAASKVMIGAIVLGSYNLLYDKGIITANLDTPGETNKARELARAGGVMPPGTLNVSGLARYLKGEDPKFRPGDDVKDLAKFGVSGAFGMMVGTARRFQERSRVDSPDWLTAGAGIVLSGTNFILQQGFLNGVNSYLKTLSQESGASLEKFIKTFLSTSTSPIHPAILGNLMRAEREYVPVTGGEDVIKDFTNELNQKYAALPFVEGKQLPLRRDLWGNAVEQTPKSENPWFYNFISPWRGREIDADPLNASIYRVWRRTADNRAIPPIPNPQITYGKVTYEKLTPAQFDRYAQLVGHYRRYLAEQVFMTKNYQTGSDDARIASLNRAYDMGLARGKYRFVQELRQSGQQLTPLPPRRGFEE